MAHKKGVGSSNNGRDSMSKRLGVKLFGGQFAKAGNIIIRQRGTKFHPGENVYMGKDFTIHAKVDGFVTFKVKRKKRTYVSIIPISEELLEAAANQVEETVAPQEMLSDVKDIETKVEEEIQPQEGATTSMHEEVKEETSENAAGDSEQADDLTKIEGIGPKLKSIFHEAGIKTFAQLAEKTPEELKEIMINAGGKGYARFNPATWPAQAKMAAEGKWDELKEWQDKLDGGKE